uniref:E3 ubiquitin/ISG15 ligase TRIM25-like n=1 Tax=Leptobrachium leishanense TaxID=445787 RepID=A0A8C5LJJ0_9ANUR
MASTSLRDELTCSICMDIYSKPATLTCGHSYCQGCITRTWDNQEEREYTCPECVHRFRAKPKLSRSQRLANIVDNFRSTHPEHEDVGIHCRYCLQASVPAVKTCLHCDAHLCADHFETHSKLAEHVFVEPTSFLENKTCSVHKKILEYYCCEDATLICVYCRVGEEHSGHQVETLTEALEKKKNHLRNILEKLTSERQDAELRVQSLQELGRQAQAKANVEKERAASIIKAVEEQLEALGKRVFGEIARQEEKVSLQISAHIQLQESKKEELSRKMSDIEGLCNMTDPLTVLRERESHKADYCVVAVGDTSDSGDAEAHNVGHLDVAMISVTLHSGLAEILNGVMGQRRALESPDLSPSVNTPLDILLDVNTASHNVSVSEDLKTVSLAGIDQSHPGPPERFQSYPQVLSSRSFSSGIHYWEVEGSESGVWEVGVAYPGIDRTGEQSWFGNNNKSWVLRRWNEMNLYYVTHNCNVKELHLTRSCRRVGIYLDYEAGRLSFYELCDPIRHLYTFSATFTEPLHAVFGVEGIAFVSVNGIFTDSSRGGIVTN